MSQVSPRLLSPLHLRRVFFGRRAGDRARLSKLNREVSPGGEGGVERRGRRRRGPALQFRHFSRVQFGNFHVSSRERQRAKRRDNRHKFYIFINVGFLFPLQKHKPETCIYHSLRTKQNNDGPIGLIIIFFFLTLAPFFRFARILKPLRKNTTILGLGWDGGCVV